MLDHTTKIRVRYADTDQMQFVYNGKYSEYFEIGRTEMMRSIGLPYQTMEANGFMLPLLELRVYYKNPAYYDDLLEIRAFVKELPVLRIHIDYEIFRTDKKIIIAEGYTEHVFINKESKRAVRPPDFFMNAIKPYYLANLK
ncbi:MAG: acyl-CoA thioesterase [Ignavibacteriaceae bacterium]|nr:acyl-CoA thioesterase [Ignavibacteriaceae bacterium]